MKPTAVLFESHLLIPGGSWEEARDAILETDFHTWLLEYVGFGFEYPLRGVDRKIHTNCEWFFLEDRRNERETPKWQKAGFHILFFDSRKAVLAKIKWGGKYIGEE